MVPSFLLFLGGAPALAGDPVQGGLQAAVFPDGLDFVEDYVAGYTLDLEESDVGGEYGCYDRIGVHDFNLYVPVDTVDLELTDGALDITVRFDQIYAEDFTVYGQDEDYLDACIEFEADVLYAQVDDAVLDVSVSAAIQDGELVLEVLDSAVQGDIDTDIAWFPDDLALAYFEEAILDGIAGTVGEYVPDLVSTYVGAALFGTDYGEFSFEVGLDQASISRDSLGLRASPSIAWTGTDGCPSEDRGEDPAGANPQLGFGEGDGSSLAIGVTEGTINELFLAAWRDGYFCFTEDNIDEFISLVAAAFDPGVAGLQGTASLLQAPRVRVDNDGLHFELADIGATITGQVDGESQVLLDVRGDVTGLLELGLDQELSSFTLSVRELDIELDQLQADHLVAQGDEGEAELARFVEDWVGGWTASMAQDMVLFSSLYYFWEIALRVDRIDPVNGGLMVYVSLFDADDPQVDGVAPDTQFRLDESTDEYVQLELQGTDDRPGALAFSVQVDGAGFSAWSTDPLYRLTGLGPGVHYVEVISRDQWLNVDPTPAEGWLELGDEGTETRACACATGGPASALFLLLGGLAGLVRRRSPSGRDRAG